MSKDFEALMQNMGAFDSPKDAQIALNSIISSLTQSLVKGEDITLEGLGTFTVVEEVAPMKGPTVVPGDPKREFHKTPQSIKRVKIKFDKVLKYKVNEVKG